MIKKLIAVLIAAAACTCVFAACGTNQNTTKKITEPDVIIQRDLPENKRRGFDGVFPVPPEHGIAKPTPLPAPHRRNGFYLK